MILRSIVVTLCAAVSVLAQSAEYRELWNDPAVVQRIDDGIRANRMGWATLRFVDAAGHPVTGVKVDVEQIRHQFLFGANLFMLGGFPTEAENRDYERTFLGLFNYGTAAFYWKTLEPKPGEPRFAVSSQPVFRRPPPDVAVEFARRSGIVLKGHPLVWDSPQWQHPDWAPQDPAAVDRLLRKRIEQIAERYRGSIAVWDVVNEVFNRKYHMHIPMPQDFVYRAFETAAKVFPVDTKLTLNEAASVWTDFQDETSPFYLLIENLLLRGAAVNTIGMQMHIFSEDVWRRNLNGTAMKPLDVLRVLDRYGDFHLPIHITEITVPALPDTAAGEAAQAEVVRNLYRLWFSHPAVEAITWWNLVDNTAVPGENRWLGGLVHRDFSPKPAYEVLRKLIQEDWRTRLKGDTGAKATMRLQGFYGRYRATVVHNGRTSTTEFDLAKGAGNVIDVRLGDAPGN